MIGWRNKSALQKRNNLGGLLFLMPLIVVFVLLMGYSFYFLIKNSFVKVTISFKNAEFVGFSNYRQTIVDKQFWRALLNTFLLAFSNIFFGLTIAFFISVFLNFKLRGKKFFHALFFIPSMLPIALIATVFNSMLQYKNGAVNTILRSIGLGVLTKRWLGDPNIAIFSIMSVSLFMIGIPIMYYTAALTTISSSILEAATIDGAKMKDLLFRILYPMLKNTHKTIILSMLLGGFREMDRVYLMTDGGPGGKTEIIGTYIYRMYRNPGANLGRISAIAILVIIISFTIGFVQMRFKNNG